MVTGFHFRTNYDFPENPVLHSHHRGIWCTAISPIWVDDGPWISSINI